MSRFKYYLIIVAVFALWKLCTMYFPYLVNALYMPNEELGSFLVESGFHTDFSSLEQVQRLVALLNQTRASSPVYVNVLFGVNFMHRQMLPPMNVQLILNVLVSEMGSFFHPKKIFTISHEFYMNAIAGALYGPWYGVTFCCLMASISAAMWFPLKWLIIQIVVWYIRLQARTRAVQTNPDNLNNQIENQPVRLVQAELPANQNAQARLQAQRFLRFPWWIRALLRLLLVALFALLRAILLYSNWAFNMGGPLVLEKVFPFENYWTIFAMWLTGAAIGQIPYSWYCAASIGVRLSQLSTIDGALDNWLCYAATFCSIMIALCYTFYRAIRGDEDEEDDEDDEDDDQED